MKQILSKEVDTTIFLWFGTIILIFIAVAPYVASNYWVTALCASLRVQCAIGAILLAIWAVASQKKISFIILLAIIGLNIYEFLPHYLPIEKVKASNIQLRLMHSNVYSSNKSYERLIDYIHKVDPDIILLQEVTGLWENAMVAIHKTYPYHISRSREDNFGISLYSKHPLDNTKIQYFSSKEVPSITTDILIKGKKLHLVGTHPVPPIGPDYFENRNKQLKSIAEYCVKHQEKPLVLIGDLNTTPWSLHYKKLLETSRLSDSLDGYGIQLSWPASPIVSKMYSTSIDHCLISKDITVLNRIIGEDINSDHYPLIVDIGL